MRMKSGDCVIASIAWPCGAPNEDIAALNRLDRMLEAGISQWEPDPRRFVEGRLIRIGAGLLSSVLRLGPRRLFARPAASCWIVTPAERNPVSNTVLTEAGSNPISLAFGGWASLFFNRSAKCNCSQRC